VVKLEATTRSDGFFGFRSVIREVVGPYLSRTASLCVRRFAIKRPSPLRCLWGCITILAPVDRTGIVLRRCSRRD
jgi:hypothetical protein